MSGPALTLHILEPLHVANSHQMKDAALLSDGCSMSTFVSVCIGSSPCGTTHLLILINTASRFSEAFVCLNACSCFDNV